MCTVIGCERTAERRGWCGRHYAKWRRYGDPTAGRTNGETDPRDSALVRLYGITGADYDRMLTEQGGVCAVCRQPETRRKRARRPETVPLCVDHDHNTGEVRGLLCHVCNVLVGWLEDRARVERALAYLDSRQHIFLGFSP